MATAPPGGGIRRVLVLANYAKPAVRDLVRELEPWLGERVESVRLATDIRAFAAERARAAAAPAGGPEGEEERPDLLVVLGGDGALLGAVRSFAGTPVPTLGINLGRVGFLASTPASRWRETLEGVLGNEGVLELRMRVQAEWEEDAERCRAVGLNEICVQRGSHQGMLELVLFVDGDWVTNYRADGVVVATPSGSTAYSLSAGGPILEPGVHGLVVTPICSQALSNRSVVLHAERELVLTVHPADGPATLAVDGQSHFPLGAGCEVRIRRHPRSWPLYAMPGLDSYRRLRERLGWRGTLEADEPGGGSEPGRGT